VTTRSRHVVVSFFGKWGARRASCGLEISAQGLVEKTAARSWVLWQGFDEIVPEPSS